MENLIYVVRYLYKSECLYFYLLLATFMIPCSCLSTKIIWEHKNQFILGGLFPVHARSTDDDAKTQCGVLLKNKGIQRLEAMLYALDEINKLWNISLGATILDTCSSDSYALEQTLGFLKMSNCEGNVSMSRRVTAVVGAANSPVSESVANILRLFKVPQVSYASTSETLDDDHKFPYFYRVVPSDKFQVEAILDLIRSLNWNYLSVVYSKGEYGEQAVKQLQTIIHTSNLEDICFASINYLPREPTKKSYNDLVENLLSYQRARAVIVFLNEDKLRYLFEAVKRRNARGHFLWIGSDSWGTKTQPIEDLEDVLEGAITLLPKRFPIPGFDEYFRSLKPKTNLRNPWFKKYWESQFKCVFQSRSSYPQPFQKHCSGNEVHSNYKQEGLVPMVVDSVYVIAHAIRSMCHEKPIDCMNWDVNPKGLQLKEYMSKVSFPSSQKNQMVISFGKDKNIPVNYTVYQLRKVGKPGNTYDYVPIGEWNLDTRLALSEKPSWKSSPKIKARFYDIPGQSSCSNACEAGHEKLRKPNARCCWTCRQCEGDTFLPHPNDICRQCKTGHIANPNHTSCIGLEATYMGSNWSSPWVLVPFLFACFGIAGTLITSAVFIMYRNTPIIKASGRELCYTILGGILLCYCCTFVAVLKPTKWQCGILRVSLGLGVSVCYSAIFTKTNRISRIFNRRFSTAKRPAYISPRSQLIIVTCMVFTQITISAMWLIIHEPTVSTRIHAKQWIVVCGIDHSSVLFSLMYNIFLIILCTVYTFKTRNIPENFNEAKFISFSMYSSCIVWLAFIAIYSSTDFEVQSSTLCMTVSMSGTVILVCLFFPKIYLVLLKPHKNVKHTTTTQSASAMDTATPNVRFVKPARPKLATPSTSSSHGTYQLSPSPMAQLRHESDA